jgi:hypothetical protein
MTVSISALSVSISALSAAEERVPFAPTIIILATGFPSIYDWPGPYPVI